MPEQSISSLNSKIPWNRHLKAFILHGMKKSTRAPHIAHTNFNRIVDMLFCILLLYFLKIPFFRFGVFDMISFIISYALVRAMQ